MGADGKVNGGPHNSPALPSCFLGAPIRVVAPPSIASAIKFRASLALLALAVVSTIDSAIVRSSFSYWRSNAFAKLAEFSLVIRFISESG
jgi:hypothetical protein